MNLLIFGSSITWGAWDQEGGWAQRIKRFADQKAVLFKHDSYTAVYCLGVSGDTTDDLLQRFDTEVKARLDEEGKTVILIEIGINDSQYALSENKHRVSPEKYKKNLLTLVEKSKHHQADLIFVGLTPVDDSKVDPTPWTPGRSYRQEFVYRYEEVLKDLCTELKLPFIELMSKFTDKSLNTLLRDGLHPNTKGHRIMYAEVKKYLLGKGLII